jgi:two-component system alkaline phosphatase synthesis response regulator PhoP
VSKTILIVDDQPAIRSLLKDFLRKHDYDVLEASNGREALEVTSITSPDAVLLDVMMPEMDGFEFTRQFRQKSDAPIILITAKSDESDKVVGLELGADDYLTKPFGMRELLARLRAVMRRSQYEIPGDGILRIGSLTINPSQHRVTVNDEPIDVTRTEFQILELLGSAPGRAYSRAQILDHISGHDADGSERTVDVHVRNVRAKIEAESSKPTLLVTVFGVGYRLQDPENL